MANVVFVTNGILKVCGMPPRALILNNVTSQTVANQTLSTLVARATETIGNPDPSAILAHQSNTRTKVSFTVATVSSETLIADQTNNVLILCCASEDSVTIR